MSCRLFIQAINEQLQPVFSRPNAQLFGLCQSIIRSVGESKQLLPCLVDDQGEGKYVGIDTLKGLMLYHKSNSIAVSEKSGSGYGDSRSDKVFTYQNSMIVFIDRKVVKKLPDEVVLIIQSILCDGIKIKGFKTVNIRLQNIILNSQQVFASEYQNVDYRIPPGCNLFSINYQIESVFDKNCFATECI